MSKILKHVYMANTDYQEPGLGNGGSGGSKGSGSGTYRPAPGDASAADVVNASKADGLENILNWNPTTVSGGTSNGGIVEAMENMRAMIASQINPPFVVSLLPVETAHLLVGSIVMYARYAGFLYYAVFILESTAKPLGMQEIGGGYGRERSPSKVPMTPDCFYNIEMIDYIEDLLVNKLGITPTGKDKRGDPIYPIFGIGDIIIGKDVEVKLREKLAGYFDSALYSIQAAILMNNQKATTRQRASDLAADGKELLTTYSVNCGATNVDRFGHPNAADFSVVQTLVTAKRRTSGNRGSRESWREEIHTRGSEAVTAITAYLDMRRTNNAETSGRGRNRNMVPGYDPVVVITSNNCLGLDGNSYNTLMSTLLGLTLIHPIMDPEFNRWAALYDPGVSDSQNLPPLGLLGLEYDPSEPNRLTPEVVKLAPSTVGGSTADGPTVQDFVASYFTSNIVVAVDKLRGGPTEFFMDILATADVGSDNEQIILDELDDYMDGQFSKLWLPRNEPIVVAKTAIYAGHFKDESKNPRDCRSINYLRMLDQTEADQSIFDGFARGLEPDTDSMEDMAEKYALLAEIAHDLVITGVYDRLFINVNFITDMIEALERCGVTSTVEGLRDLANNSSRRNYNSQYFTKMKSGTMYRSNNGRSGSNVAYGESAKRSVFRPRSR